MDGQQNWGQNPAYHDPNYQGSHYPKDPPYQTQTTPGYDFNTVSNSPLYSTQPAYGNYPMDYEVDSEGAKGLGVASMILGIVSLGLSFLGLFFSPFCLVSLLSSIVGVILGGISLSKYKRTGATDGKGMAIAGVIMNAINLVLALIGVLIVILFIGMLFSMGY